MQPGSPAFLFKHLEARNPALICLRDPGVTLDTLNAIARDQDCPVRFSPKAPRGALDYEKQIVHEGQVHTRIHTWHDRFNAAMWLLWPQSKLSISRAHLAAALAPAAPGTRNQRRDALTLLDESGVVLLASPNIEAIHRDHDWSTLFWEQRSQWFRTIHPLFLGHGLAEQCLTPYLGLTGKALYLHAAPEQVDAQLAQHLSDPAWLASPRQLCPFPLLGTPSWHPDNDKRDFYNNSAYFRPRPRRSSSLSSRN